MTQSGSCENVACCAQNQLLQGCCNSLPGCSKVPRLSLEGAACDFLFYFIFFFLNLEKVSGCRDSAGGAVWQEGCGRDAAAPLA